MASPLVAAISLRRLFPYSTASNPPAGFVAEEFLVTKCGLTPSKALRASRYRAHLKSPSNPEAVIDFLTDMGLDKADIAAAVARKSQILCSRVDETLIPRFAQLRNMGLTPLQISRLITIIPDIMSSSLMISRLAFYISFLSSYEKVHAVLRRSYYFLNQDVERVVKPNITFLQQYGMTDCDIGKLFKLAPGMIILEPERVKEIVSCAEKIGIPRDSSMFKHALASIYNISPGRVNSRSNLLMKTLGCSEAELGMAVRKFPYILNSTEDRLSRSVDFLVRKVGLEPNYIAHRPSLLARSMTRRLVPRHFILETLKAKGLMKKDKDFFTVVIKSEKKFHNMFLDPYKESVPGFADAYVAACAGQVPPLVLP
ncbi:hypothetical protein PR202_gb09837 [Eleusine coracana subsp. coracana]|uniref:Uncharacterized protein n=1 Tax=Eleusine coracana subsp. coracana TaxID=191504 RepID=A0AAV5EIU9_ELECO|nr:hypothetical protein PR202_gb09837 [Eleusine coracana subsp. coracana]